MEGISVENVNAADAVAVIVKGTASPARNVLEAGALVELVTDWRFLPRPSLPVPVYPIRKRPGVGVETFKRKSRIDHDFSVVGTVPRHQKPRWRRVGLCPCV